jgi:hypothetical protein
MSPLYFRSTYRYFFYIGISLVIFGTISLNLENKNQINETYFNSNECKLDYLDKKLEDLEDLLERISIDLNCK